MNKQLGTPSAQKSAIAFPEADAHVIGNADASKDVEGVYSAMIDFAFNVLHMKPKEPFNSRDGKK
jgi:hypothetical protein